MEEKMIGPRLTDEAFFREKVDTTLPGMEGLEEAAAAGDYAACRKIFAARVRKYLRVDLYDQLTGGPEKDRPELEKLQAQCEDICKNRLISCGIPYQFGEVVDWEFNATANGYVEWTWQLNRHPHWRILSRAYRLTGDERYAECFARQFESWVHQAVAPESCFGNQTLCWRSIETGLRSSGTLPLIIHAFYRSPAFTDDILVDFYKSVWEHGNRLEKNHMRANWLIMEMNGLCHIAMMFPELKDSSRWYDFVVDMLHRQLTEQIHPDGYQAELSIGYHNSVVSNYMRALRVAKAYGHPMGQELYDAVEKMIEVFIKLMKPNGAPPDQGDGRGAMLSQLLANYFPDFQHNDIIRWAVTGGKEGTEPPYTSVVLPYSGVAALRTDWSEDALFAFFDGGPYGMNHQHQDKLNLTVYANGRYILPEASVYCYDTSEMRRYVLSTRGHNTVRVNSMDQNRQQEFHWDSALVQQHSGMVSRLSDDVDYVAGEYNEGYNNASTETAFPKDGLPPVDPATLPELYKGATHKRGVMMIKHPAGGLRPFILVFDRLESNDENDYEVLWHIDNPSVMATENSVDAGDFAIMMPSLHKDTMGMAVVRGQQGPETQGWIGATMLQGDYRPIWAAKVMLHASSIRLVTVLYPYGEGTNPIESVEAGTELTDTTVTLHLKNGETLTYSEEA